MSRAVRIALVGVALLALGGCATLRGGDRASELTVDDYLATLPPEKTRPIGEAENALYQAERQVPRVDQATALARLRRDAARVEADMRAQAVEHARILARLVRQEHLARLEGAAVGPGVPADLDAAARRLEEAEHEVRVAEWTQGRADAETTLRERELEYARAFADATRRQVDLKRAEVELTRRQVVAANMPDPVPGVIDPRVATAQAALRDAQAAYTRAHADAAERLARAQIGGKGMARFEGGPPSFLASLGLGRSGAAPLAPAARQVELEPLPWPMGWEEPRPGTTGRRQPAAGRRSER